MQQEADGVGIPPPEFRSTLLEQYGVHELTIGPGADSDQTLHALQKILGFSADAATALARNIPGAVLRGTDYEIEWLAGVLVSRGIPATMGKAPDGDSRSVDLADI